MTVTASKLAVAHQSVGEPGEGGSCAVDATEAVDVVVVAVKLVASPPGGAVTDWVGGLGVIVVADGAENVAAGAKFADCVAAGNDLIVGAVVEVIVCVVVGMGVVVR